MPHFDMLPNTTSKQQTRPYLCMHKAKHLKVECSSYVTVIKHFRCKSQRNIKRRGRQSRVEAFTERGETLERNEQEYLVTDNPEIASKAASSIPPQQTLLDDSDDAAPSSSEREPQEDSGDHKRTSHGYPQRQNSYKPAKPYGKGPRYSGSRSERSSRPMLRNFSLERLQFTPSQPLKRGTIGGHLIQAGTTVVGTVIGGSNGWRVALEQDPDIIGFCPLAELPHILKDRYKEQPHFEDTILGTKRNFLVLSLPHDMEYNGKGPLLSARMPDTDVIWRRAEQMREVCQEDGDVISVTLATSNNGGMLGFVDGLPLFIPWSYLPRLNFNLKSHDEFIAAYIGKKVVVSVQDVNRQHNRFVGNVIDAMNNTAYARLKIGDLVWGVVNAIVSYGAFVTMDEYPSVRALLHIANISQEHVRTVEDIFVTGQRIRCAVIGIDQENRQLSLSTAELEKSPGEMLREQEDVYERAEEAIQDYLAYVKAQREADAAQGSSPMPKGTSENGSGLNW